MKPKEMAIIILVSIICLASVLDIGKKFFPEESAAFDSALEQALNFESKQPVREIQFYPPNGYQSYVNSADLMRVQEEILSVLRDMRADR